MKEVKDLTKFIPYIIIIILILVIRVYCYSIIRVNGSSMYPNLLDGDLMILDKVSYYVGNINRFDIVVVNNNGEDIIKRVIGLPGETVEYIDNQLYINGLLMEEPFEREVIADHKFEEQIPLDKYIVIGDNRVNSKDSRSIGFIDETQIEGKASITIFPFDRLGIKE